MKRVRPSLAVLCAALLAVPAAAGERQLKEEELARLREHIGSLRQSLETTRDRFSTVRAELRDTERRLGRLTRNIRALDGRIAEQRRRIAALEGERASLRASIRRQREHLAEQVRASHAMGRQPHLKLVLNQEDPAAMGRVLAYYDYMNLARSERIKRLDESVARLETLGAELQAEASRLEGMRAERADELGRVQDERRQRTVLLVKLREEIDTKDKRLARLLQDERDLVRLLEGLAEAVDDLPSVQPGQPFAKSRGRLPWPTRGTVAAHFGAERGVGRLHWQGMLIRAAEGQEVRAVSHGRVAFADWLRGYGLLVIIDHGAGYMSLYGHNQTVLKEVGDWVQAGDVIATVGDSGGSEQAALYFEIRYNGKPLDPAKWVSKRRG
ncbi:MAG: murein hydrolase activator EnvC [Thiohalomonadaceae bacterium]